MLEAKWYNGFEDLTDCHMIRETVFMKEQNVPVEIEMDNTDELCMHIVLYDNDKPCATARVMLDNDMFIIGRVAVLKEYRGQKYGDFIVRLAIRKAFESGGEKQIVNSQTSVKEFYEKLGFKAVGEPFIKAGIEHIKMERMGDINCYC